jgi:type 1 fimbriae regulatory protein FimB
VLHVIRLKHGLSTTHSLRADELRAINAWLKVRASMKVPTNVKTFFVSGQRKPLHRSTVNLLLQKYSAATSLPVLKSRQTPRSVGATGECWRCWLRSEHARIGESRVTVFKPRTALGD